MSQSKINEGQVGGAHYKTQYHHWDWVIDTGLGYFDGNATRYVVRWRKKNGIEDLKKALHYLNKLIESWTVVKPPEALVDTVAHAENLKEANDLTFLERDFCLALSRWETADDLYMAKGILLALIDAATPEPKPVPLEDSNKHSERAERS